MYISYIHISTNIYIYISFGNVSKKTYIEDCSCIQIMYIDIVDTYIYINIQYIIYIYIYYICILYYVSM